MSDDLRNIIIENAEPEDMDLSAKKKMSETCAKERFDAFKEKVLTSSEPLYCMVDVACWEEEPNGTKRACSKIGLLNW